MHGPPRQETAIAPVAVRGLRVARGGRQILSGVDLTVAPGEVLGLVGLNGAGKTTLIRALLDLGPAEGDIRLFGRPHTEPAARTGLVYLPEKYQPSPHLTGWEHLRLNQHWLGRRLDRARCEDLARRLAFDPAALGRRVRTYSKGMGQKLGLISALAGDTPLLVLDEPMSGLDPRARVRLKDLLLAAREGGRSVFFSSHVLADIEEICDRIAVLHDGRLIHLGTPGAFIAAQGGGTLERAFLTAIGDAA